MNNSIYGEAFMLMHYRCNRCHSIEQVWNSRDGITPFNIGSPCCDEEYSSHVNFDQDIYFATLPESALLARVFVDMSKDHAMTLALDKFERMGDEMMNTYAHLKFMGKENLINRAFVDYYGQGKQPCVISVSEYKRKIDLDK